MTATYESLRFGLGKMARQQSVGRVTRVRHLGVDVGGLRTSIGDLCEIQLDADRSVAAEVVAVDADNALVMPFSDVAGLSPGARVLAGASVQPVVPVGPALKGRVVDAFAAPIDGLGDIPAIAFQPLLPQPLNPLLREPVSRQLPTGVRAIDTLLPIGVGQRIGVFSGSGVGKTTLLGMLARHVAADVNVIALIGERGREVHDFLVNTLDEPTRKRTVVVVATSDQPALKRARAAYTATAIAEHFRDRGAEVFFMMDSVTRFAMARREIDLASGQPPTSRGYTPSVFAAIPALAERCGGLAGKGAITAVYSVLVEGDDLDEPVSDALRASLDGHIVLSRELANAGHFPAIDVLQSLSRLDTVLLKDTELTLAREARATMATHRRQSEMVDMGLYKAGSNPALDAALACWPELTSFLRQEAKAYSSVEHARKALRAALKGGAAS